MKFLLQLTSTQLWRLYCAAYDRMSEGDGYQPYGYDWPTLRITKPGWYRTLRMIFIAGQRRLKLELRQKRTEEERTWAEAEAKANILGTLRAAGL